VFANVLVIQCHCNSCLRKGIGEYNFDYNLYIENCCNQSRILL